MSALEILKKLKKEMKSPDDNSLSPEAKEHLSEVFEKYFSDENQMEFDHHGLKDEVEEVIDRFNINHHGLIDFVNVLSNLGI